MDVWMYGCSGCSVGSTWYGCQLTLQDTTSKKVGRPFLHGTAVASGTYGTFNRLQWDVSLLVILPFALTLFY